MKLTRSIGKESKENVDDKTCATPLKSASKQQIVIPNGESIPVTSENDEFYLWNHNRGLGRTDKSCSCWKPVIVVMVLLGALIALMLFAPINKEILFGRRAVVDLPNTCSNSCKIELVESIPVGLVYPDGSPSFLSTYEAWDRLIKLATKTINIGSFNWNLRGADFYNHSTAWQGENIFNSLLDAGTKGGIKIQIAQSAPPGGFRNFDTEIFVRQNAAKVRTVDFNRLLGGGWLHTKLWIVDGQHMYVGSANLDWRSLTQVKELGVLLTNCSCLVDDVSKIFNVYWDMGKPNAIIPPNWPTEYSTKINASNPVPVNFNDEYKMNTFFSSSPSPMSPLGRSQDIDAIVQIIQNAKTFIHISSLDFIPLWLYTESPKFWPVIDNALRAAAIDRRVSVKLLISSWSHSPPFEDLFLNSLKDISDFYLSDVQVRRFICPATDDQAKIPFARVNDNKYMVTDNVAYIGTSNWTPDFFMNSAGIGVVLQEASKFGRNDTMQSIRKDLASLFERDWSSAYAVELKKPKTS